MEIREANARQQRPVFVKRQSVASEKTNLIGAVIVVSRCVPASAVGTADDGRVEVLSSDINVIGIIGQIFAQALPCGAHGKVMSNEACSEFSFQNGLNLIVLRPASGIGAHVGVVVAGLVLQGHPLPAIATVVHAVTVIDAGGPVFRDVPV